MTLRMNVHFAGCGGDSQGSAAVPGVELQLAANHNALALQTHAANFPDTDHHQGDLQEADLVGWPYAELFWASPACPPWSGARGQRRDFDQVNRDQTTLFGGTETDAETLRARALMEEVPRYLAAMARRGRPVLAGVVENVPECRLWADWDRWLGEIQAEGYRTRIVALNAMHAQAVRVPRAPQSRDRLFVAYWHRKLGRDPDWEKWLRPRAYCRACDLDVDAVQTWRKPGADMGEYRRQYDYRCSQVTCGRAIVEPYVLPAAVAIDWTDLGTRIGDRTKTEAKPEGLAPKTILRLQAGMRKHWKPLLVPAGGTWRDSATPVDEPMPARTTRESDGIAVPPLLIPVEGRAGMERAAVAYEPFRTQTARNETGLALPPLLVEMRGGGSKARTVLHPMHTVSAQGNHHGLAVPAAAMVVRNNGSKGDGGEMCTSALEPLRSLTTKGHQSLVRWDHLLMPYYGTGGAQTERVPIGTITTRDRWALASGTELPAVGDVLFRMLKPVEIGAGMAFTPAYRVLGSKRDQVRQYGNAVPPPMAEVLVSALVECITGDELDRVA